jgi:hypothetical protein
MKIPLSLAALILMAGISRADVVMVQTVDGLAQTGTMTVMVGADKIRTDVSPMVSTITDTTSGDVTTLNHVQHSYMVISSAMTKAMMAEMSQSGDMPSAPGAATATGKTDTVNGFKASEYTYTNGNMKATYWLSTDFPNGDVVKAALQKFQKGGLAAMTKAFAPDISTLPGVPVKTEVEINGQKITTQLISAQEQTVDPSEYQVPPGYTQVNLPSMPGMPSMPSAPAQGMPSPQ